MKYHILSKMFFLFFIFGSVMKIFLKGTKQGTPYVQQLGVNTRIQLGHTWAHTEELLFLYFMTFSLNFLEGSMPNNLYRSQFSHRFM